LRASRADTRGRRPARTQGASKRLQSVRKTPARRGSFLGFLFRGLFSVLFVGALAGGLVVAYHAASLPATDGLFAVKGEPSITLIDSQGRTIAKRGAGAGRLVELDELPLYLPQAVLAIEDRRFYEHHGVDVLGVARALFANWEAGRIVQGGSTITQQLAKNLFLTSERTFGRKVEEALLAAWLEVKFSKDQILTLYLNRVYFGAGAFGVEAAARRYFGRSATEVTLAQAAMLAGLLKAPSRFAPTNDRDAAEARAKLVLEAMEEVGYIDRRQRMAADLESIPVASRRHTTGSSYFADFAYEQASDLIASPQADLIVETTLDLDMQRAAEETVLRRLDGDGVTLKAGQAALVALDPKGAIRVMVGGRDYAASQFNRAVQAQRPPGSAFKPFVFLAALEHGFMPDSLVLDAPVTMKNWQPENYEQSYEGQVSLTRAFARSLNSVAVRLILETGSAKAVEVARRLGIASPLKAQPALALGASETNLLELTGAYAPFANGGLAAKPYAVNRILTRDGDVLYDRAAPAPKDVMSPVHATGMALMMEATVQGGTAKRAQLSDRPAAGKTGTSQDFRDAWFVGFTRGLVTGVWTGNDDNSKMVKVTGGSLPALIWHDFMEAVKDKTEAGALVALEFGGSSAEDPGWYAEPGPEDAPTALEPAAESEQVSETVISGAASSEESRASGPDESPPEEQAGIGEDDRAALEDIIGGVAEAGGGR
jgi:penicillin-binding protein 1A